MEALTTLTGPKVHLGHFVAERVACRYCGRTGRMHRQKMSGVSIAVPMTEDAFQDPSDVALLLSGDGKVAGLVETIRRLLPAKKVGIAFPPRRVSKALERVANAHRRVGRSDLARSQLLDPLIKTDGDALHGLLQWR